MDPKKRLRILPEVLPAPTPPAAAGGPRQRTLANMERLMAMAAAAAVLQAGCSEKTGPAPAPVGAAEPTSVSPTAPDASASAAPSASAEAPPTATPAVTASAATAKPGRDAGAPSGHGRGYGVVDPMPRPFLHELHREEKSPKK